MRRPATFLLVLALCGGVGLVLAAVVVPAEDARPTCVRGDANQDGGLSVSDPIATLRFLFLGEELHCFSAADANDDERFDITDGVFTLLYEFGGGMPPAAPFFECGLDPTPDDLGCRNPGPCAPIDEPW